MKTLEEAKATPKLESIIKKDGPLFDVIIIGAGPAGLTAAIYTGRAKLKTLIIEKALVGGMAGTTNLIENFPGFPKGISGIELTQKIEEQARQFGATLYYGEVLTVKSDKTVEVDKYKLNAKAIIIATGSEPKKLGVPGESDFRGRGVSFCATCDGPFYKDKNIAVIGGGNAAIEEAIYLTRFASKVTVVHRRDKLRADKILVERALNNPKIFIIWNTTIEKIEGEKQIENILVYNSQTKTRTRIPVNGIFVYIGMKPNTQYLKDLVKLDENGFIKVDQNFMTDANGIFACGDVIAKPLKQIITAASDGAVAAHSALKFIEESKH